jgi:hypothetical protein
MSESKDKHIWKDFNPMNKIMFDILSKKSEKELKEFLDEAENKNCGIVSESMEDEGYDEINEIDDKDVLIDLASHVLFTQTYEETVNYLFHS